MDTSFEVLERGPAVLYGDCSGIWVMILHRRPSVVDMELARPALKSMHERHPDGFPTLTWVLPEAGWSMDADARQTAAAVTKAFDAAILTMANVVEGEGFAAAAVRAIVAGIDLLSRAAAPKKTFKKLDDAVAWCASRRPTRDRSGTNDAMISAISAIRTGLASSTG